jgi:hypothetical protein
MFVIPNEVRNPSWIKTKTKRDSSRKNRALNDAAVIFSAALYSTVTDFAKFRGWSTSQPRLTAMW